MFCGQIQPTTHIPKNCNKSQFQASGGLKGNIFNIVINCTSDIIWTLHNTEGESIKMTYDPVWFQLFFPLCCDSVFICQKSLSCAEMCCWVCHFQHMPHIHRTLPNSEVCEPQQRWAFYLYLHHDNIMGGWKVIRAANILTVFLKPLQNGSSHISSRT